MPLRCEGDFEDGALPFPVPDMADAPDVADMAEDAEGVLLGGCIPPGDTSLGILQ